MTGRIVVIALSAVLTLFPVAIAILYVLGETYGQWVTGLGRDANGIFAVHDGPGGIPMILFTFLSWALLGLLLIGVIARTIWLLSHHQKPGFLLTSWLSMLILCAASFLPSHAQYAVATVALKGPGENWKSLERNAATTDSVLLLDALLLRGAALDHSIMVDAARAGSNKVVRRLLDLGVPIDEVFLPAVPSNWPLKRITALHAAVSARRHSTAELLVRAGARVDIPDARGKSPLDHARAQADEQMLAILLRGQKGP